MITPVFKLLRVKYLNKPNQPILIIALDIQNWLIMSSHDIFYQ